MNLFDSFFALQFGWRDAVDIAIVAFLLYTALYVTRGTKAMQMSVGIVLLAGAYYVARTMDLAATERVFAAVLFYLPFALIVLFQHEIRLALAAFGRTPLLRFMAQPESGSRVEKLVEATMELAARNWGALIVVERAEGLREWAESGRQLDAQLSSELLVSIFAPFTPLHDGAAIVRGDRIAAASVVLPLGSGEQISADMGTRHRAGLGLAEETDALVVIVSEENRSMSIAAGGQLHANLSREALEALLRAELGIDDGSRA
ncbi:MAG: TIGR00159 family protein [Acidobacteria bacterium]|nr:TIGR00159 family protein [Acidobacteriota bacterium]